jgi:translation initiation factor 2 subunit 1
MENTLPTTVSSSVVNTDDDDFGEQYRFRFYRERCPCIGEVVMAKVIKIEDVGAYVKLLEYNNVNALILRSEFSRKRIRSVKRLIKEGSIEAVSVLRVDYEKGYIDLSKASVTPEDVARAEDKYMRNRLVHSVLVNVAMTANVPIEEVYQTVGWPLSDRFGHAYNAFQMLVNSGADVFSHLMMVSEVVKTHLHDIVHRRMAKPVVKVRADVDVICYTEDGIDAIREALQCAEDPVRVRLVAPPRFVMTLETLDQEAGLETLKRAVAAVNARITALGGKMNVVTAPVVVTNTDDAQIASAMEAAARENAEIDGDDGEEVYT